MRTGSLALLAACVRALPTTAPGGRSYAVVFDGGSTGTRVHVFSWDPKAGTIDGLPDIRAEAGGNMKVKPGISFFEGSPEDAALATWPRRAS